MKTFTHGEMEAHASGVCLQFDDEKGLRWNAGGVWFRCIGGSTVAPVWIREDDPEAATVEWLSMTDLLIGRNS